MKVRFTLTASRQIESALDYLARQSPYAAWGLQGRIFTVIALLQAHPHAGRATSKPGIRRIAPSTYPHVIDYRIGNEEIIVRRFRHSARRPLV